MASTKIKVFIVDESAIARKLLMNILSGEDDIEVVGESGTGQGCIIMLDELEPDIVLLQVNIKGGMSIESILKEVKSFNQNIKVILCANPDVVDSVTQYINLGVATFFKKPYQKTHVLREIRECYNQ